MSKRRSPEEVEQNIHELAKSRNMTYLGRGASKGKALYRIFSFNDCGHKVQKKHNDLIRSQPYCSVCYEEKLNTEAKEQGLEIVKKGKASDHKIYRFIKCGHKQQISTRNVRKGKVLCWECLRLQHEQEAKDVGLKLVGEGNNNNSRLYKFKDCGHKQSIQIVKVRRNILHCDTCEQIRLRKEAKKVGLTLIERDTQKNGFYVYECNTCKHRRAWQTGNIRAEQGFRCPKCFELARHEEVKDLGLLWLGDVKGRKPITGVFKFIDCGHEKRMAWHQVRMKQIICNVCEQTAFNLPSYAYLLEIQFKNFKWLKLGYSRNIKDRVRRYRLIKGCKYKTLKTVSFDTGIRAKRWEHSIHTKYKDERLNPERLFKYHQSQGAYECYPLKFKDTLLTELEAKEKRLAKT